MKLHQIVSVFHWLITTLPNWTEYSDLKRGSPHSAAPRQRALNTRKGDKFR